jgi:hypothetical protein
MKISACASIALAALLVAGCGDAAKGAVVDPPSRIVGHASFDPGPVSDAAIAAAAGLKVYFEHASVGGNVCDGIDALASQAGSRYSSGRSSGDAAAAGAWFADQAGLFDNARGNPGASAKVDIFVASMSTTLAGAVDVATFKFCFIDSPSDAAALFASVKSAVEGLEAAHPKVAFVWWTMPIEVSANAERQAYNDAVRAYCAANDKWLLDIADLESHDDSGAAVVDPASGDELLYAGYTSDGGHLNGVGAEKLAKAYWSLLARIGDS